MDIINNSIENRSGRKVMKSEEEMLTPVLSIVEEETSLGDHDEQEVSIPSSLLDTTIDATDSDDVQYEFRGDGVTYRVMPMSTDCVETITPDHQASSTASSDGAAQSVQTIYNYPFNTTGIYVIGSTPKVVDSLTPATQKTVISRVQVENNRPCTVRNDKRRATHNEIERRRRDKINNWILKLSKIIPECKSESAKANYETQSKCGILAKACDYITELRETNQRMIVFAKENEQLIGEVDSLSRKVEELRRENERLRNGLKQLQPRVMNELQPSES